MRATMPPVIALDSHTFHDVMAAQPMAACVMHRGPFAACAEAVEAVRGAGDGPWAWARVDLTEAPAIAGMFPIAGDTPHLLLMRDAVVLYCAPLPGPEAARTILDRAAALDMAKVKAEVAQERASRASLHARRACPTTWRTR
jgi:hypothetical protein